MYLALLKFYWIFKEARDWLQIHALRYFSSPIFQASSGNHGERVGKLPLSDWRFAVSIALALGEAVLRVIWQLFRWLFFFNVRSVPEFLLSTVKLVLVLSVFSIAGLYGYLSGQPNPEILAQYQRLHQQNTATALLDRQGDLIGAMPNPQRESNSVGSLYLEMVPPVYWDILDQQTGRQLNFNYQQTGLSDLLFWRTKHYKGIATTDIIAAFNPFVKSSQSLIKQLASDLKGVEQPNSRCLGWFSDICNTFSAIRLAKHAFPYLAQNHGAEFKRWVAMHNGLRGARDDFRGLRATAEVVFRKKPEQLSNAEQALLAIAQLEQPALLSQNDWKTLKDKAASVSNMLYQKQHANLASEITRGLLLLNAPKKSQAGYTTQSAQQLLAQPHLLRRGASLLGDFSSLVSSRLAAEYHQAAGERLISDAQISLPVTDNLKFQRRLLRRLQSFERRCQECGLKLLLGEAPTRSGAHLQVMVANQKGQLVRYFTRGDVGDRAIGGLSTIPAAVLLASKGNLPQTRFCNQSYRNLPSSAKNFPRGVSDCNSPEQPGHALSFQQAIQVRASLPLFNALRQQASTDALQRLYRDFALVDLRTREGNPSHGEQLAYEMSYGVVQSNPLHMLEMMHHLNEMLYGKGDPKALQSVSQFLVTDLQQARRYLEFSETASTLSLSGNYLRTPSSKESLKRLLNNETKSRGGALSKLGLLPNVRFLLTKTGQSYTKQQALRDQWLVATVMIRGKRYSISAFVGSALDSQEGLASQLSAAQIFYPIMAEIIDSLD